MTNKNLEKSLAERVSDLEEEVKRHRLIVDMLLTQIDAVKDYFSCAEVWQRASLSDAEAIRKELESMQE